MLSIFFLLLSILGPTFSQNHPEPHPQQKIISRLPGQVGDSANHLVSSLGKELGNSVGTIGRGVGEVPRAIGKAVGSVPDALGHGIGNFGDVGLNEGIHVAEAIGDTWRGALPALREIFGGIASGSQRVKRALEGLHNVSGMNLAQTVDKFRSTFQEVAEVTLEQICSLVILLESYTTDEAVAKIAPGNPMIKGIHDYLERINRAVCNGARGDQPNRNGARI